MAPETRRDDPRRRPSRSPQIIASLVTVLLATGCTDGGLTLGEISEIGEGADGAAGLSSIVRDGDLKDPFESNREAAKAADTADSAAQGASPDLKDPFVGAAAPQEGSAGVALKDPFADPGKVERRGDDPAVALKDPFAAPDPADSADPASAPDLRDPFAEPDRSAAADAGPDGTTIEPAPKRPFAEVKPTDPPSAGPDRPNPDTALRNPFAGG